MITKEKISIFKKYNGDIDLWARIGTSIEKEIMSDDDWYQIENIIQSIIISNLKFNKNLIKNVLDYEIKSELLKIARKYKK